MVTFASAFPATNNLFKPRTRLARDQSRSDSRPFPSVAAPSQLLIAFQGYFNREQQFQLLDHCLMGAVTPGRNYPNFPYRDERLFFSLKASHFQFGESFPPLFSSLLAPQSSELLPENFTDHPPVRTPSTLSNAVLQQFGVFFQVETHVELFWTTARQQRLVQRPELRARLRRRKEKFAFLRDTPPSPTIPPSRPLSVSLPPCFILACTSQVTLAPCFLRARSVAAFCSAHRRGIPARQFIRKVFFAFSWLSPQTTHHRALVHTVFQALPSSGARVHTCTREKRRPHAPRKRGSRVVAAHFRRGRWKYRTKIRFFLMRFGLVKAMSR